MRVAQAENLSGIDSVELGDQPDPAPAAGQGLIRIYGAGVGPWDVGFLSGGFPGIVLPFVPGQEVAGVVEAAGEGAGVQPEDRVYARRPSRCAAAGAPNARGFTSPNKNLR
jgi:NADPH:quinone reductase